MVVKSRSIFAEIEKVNSSTNNIKKLLTDEWKHSSGTDEDETEPCIELLLDGKYGRNGQF